MKSPNSLSKLFLVVAAVVGITSPPVFAYLPDIGDFSPASCRDYSAAEMTHFGEMSCAQKEVIFQWKPGHNTIEQASRALAEAGMPPASEFKSIRISEALAMLSDSAKFLEGNYRPNPNIHVNVGDPSSPVANIVTNYLEWSKKLFAEHQWQAPNSIAQMFNDLRVMIRKPYLDANQRQLIVNVANERSGVFFVLYDDAAVAMSQRADQVETAKKAEVAAKEKVAYESAHNTYVDQVSERVRKFPNLLSLLFQSAAFTVLIMWFFGVGRGESPRNRVVIFLSGTVGMTVAALAAGLIWMLTGGPNWLFFLIELVFFGIAFAAFRFKLHTLLPGGVPSFGGSHGSAAWASLVDAIRFGHIFPKGQVLADSFGFALGRDMRAKPNDDSRFRYMGHVLTCAPTGAGKGVGAVIPALLEYPGSAIVLDVKGENAAVTARARRTMGHEVYVVDPFGVTGELSASFNWLDSLDLLNPDVVSQSAELAEMLVVADPHAGGNAEHFNETAKDLLRGLIVYVAGNPDPAYRTIGEVRRLITLPFARPTVDGKTDFDADGEYFTDVLAEMAADPDTAFGLPCRAANSFSSKPNDERGSVLSAAQRHTAFLDDPRIAATLSRSDFSLADLKKKLMTVYVVLPSAKMAAQVRFMRGFIGAALSAITGNNVKPQFKVLFQLDEFGQLGYMKPIEDAISLVRGYGAVFWLFVQDLSQLKGVYPKWQTFLANAAKQFFGTADFDTAKYISDSLGQATIQFKTQGDSRSASMQGGNVGTSLNQQFTGRSLLTPDEVMRQGTSPIVLIQGQPPYQLARLNYLTDSEYVGQFDPNPYH